MNVTFNVTFSAARASCSGAGIETGNTWMNNLKNNKFNFVDFGVKPDKTSEHSQVLQPTEPTPRLFKNKINIIHFDQSEDIFQK